MAIDNPLQAEGVITLNDGIQRRFCFSFNSLMVYEAAVKEHPELAKSELAEMRALFFAGLWDDAQDRGEVWTLQRVGLLLPKSPSVLRKMVADAKAIRAAGVRDPGEKKADVDAAGKKPTGRVTGSKKRK